MVLKSVALRISKLATPPSPPPTTKTKPFAPPQTHRILCVTCLVLRPLCYSKPLNNIPFYYHSIFSFLTVSQAAYHFLKSSSPYLTFEGFLCFLACIDKHTSCPSWATDGYCSGDHEEYMRKNCRKSCKLCQIKTQGPSTQGPTTQGPSTQEATTQGPSTQGPTTQGPSTQGPSTVSGMASLMKILN